MIYLFIPLNTILFMAKFTMKTTTNSTTSIMLSLSLHTVITTKKRNQDSSSHCGVIALERGGTKAGQKCDKQTNRQTLTSPIEATALRAWHKKNQCDIKTRSWPEAGPSDKIKLDRLRSVGHASRSTPPLS